MIRTGMYRNPKILPDPRNLKEAAHAPFDIATVAPFVNTRVAPLNTDSVASVTIIGCRSKYAINTPLIRPATAPIASVARITTTNGISLTTKAAAMAPVNPTTDPMEISIPPRMMAKLTPAARIALIETCFSTLVRLPTERNLLLISEKIMISASRIITWR